MSTCYSLNKCIGMPGRLFFCYSVCLPVYLSIWLSCCLPCPCVCPSTRSLPVLSLWKRRIKFISKLSSLLLTKQLLGDFLFHTFAPYLIFFPFLFKNLQKRKHSSSVCLTENNTFVLMKRPSLFKLFKDFLSRDANQGPLCILLIFSHSFSKPQRLPFAWSREY